MPNTAVIAIFIAAMIVAIVYSKILGRQRKKLMEEDKKRRESLFDDLVWDNDAMNYELEWKKDIDRRISELACQITRSKNKRRIEKDAVDQAILQVLNEELYHKPLTATFNLLPLDPNKDYKTYSCPQCPGTLRPLGYAGFGLICGCDQCGKRFKR